MRSVTWGAVLLVVPLVAATQPCMGPPLLALHAWHVETGATFEITRFDDDPTSRLSAQLLVPTAFDGRRLAWQGGSAWNPQLRVVEDPGGTTRNYTISGETGRGMEFWKDKIYYAVQHEGDWYRTQLRELNLTTGNDRPLDGLANLSAVVALHGPLVAWRHAHALPGGTTTSDRYTGFSLVHIPSGLAILDNQTVQDVEADGCQGGTLGLNGYWMLVGCGRGDGYRLIHASTGTIHKLDDINDPFASARLEDGSIFWYAYEEANDDGRWMRQAVPDGEPTPLKTPPRAQWSPYGLQIRNGWMLVGEADPEYECSGPFTPGLEMGLVLLVWLAVAGFVGHRAARRGDNHSPPSR